MLLGHYWHFYTHTYLLLVLLYRTCFALYTWSNKRPRVVMMSNVFEKCCPSFPCLSQSHALTVFHHLLACGFSKTAARYERLSSPFSQ